MERFMRNGADFLRAVRAEVTQEVLDQKPLLLAFGERLTSALKRVVAVTEDGPEALRAALEEVVADGMDPAETFVCLGHEHGPISAELAEQLDIDPRAPEPPEADCLRMTVGQLGMIMDMGFGIVDIIFFTADGMEDDEAPVLSAHQNGLMPIFTRLALLGSPNRETHGVAEYPMAAPPESRPKRQGKMTLGQIEAVRQAQRRLTSGPSTDVPEVM